MNVYKFLHGLPGQLLLEYSIQAIAREMEGRGLEFTHPYRPSVHEECQKELFDFFSNAEKNCPSALAGWVTFADFFLALQANGPQNDSQHRQYQTFLNYVDLTLDTIEFANKLNKSNPHLIELGPGYGFSSYLLSELGYEILALCPENPHNMQNWLIDRFMYHLLPIKYKDIYTHEPGKISTLKTKFNTIDVIFSSGMPVFVSTETNENKLISYTENIILDMMDALSYGGLLIWKKTNLFRGIADRNKRKNLSLLLLKRLKSQNCICLYYKHENNMPELYPPYWEYADFNLVFQNQR